MKLTYFFIFLLLLASCSQEEIEENTTLKENPYSSSKISLSGVPLDNFVNKALENLAGGSQAKSRTEVDKGFLYVDEWDFYVDIRSAIRTTNKIYGNHSFTFPIIKPGKPYLTANLVLSQNKDHESYSVFLTIYRFTKEQKERVANGESAKKFIKKPEIYFLKNFLQKSVGGLKKTLWVDLETLKCYEQIDSISQGTGWETYEWEEILCPWDMADGGDSESSTEDPFENSDYDGGDVYTDPVTEEDHQIYFSFDVTTENPPYTDDYTLSLLEQAHTTFRKSLSLPHKMFLRSTANQNFENKVDAFFYSNFGEMNYNNLVNFLKEAIENKMAGGEVDFVDEVIFHSSFINSKGKCVYDYIKKKNGSLFRSTIKNFIDNGEYDLILKVYTDYNDIASARTDGSNIENGMVIIRFNNAHQSSNPMDWASSIFHEGLHAEIYRFVQAHEPGINPGDRERIMQLFLYYKETEWGDDATIQHLHMSENYVIPIAKALREIDNFQYSLDYYMNFAWDGLLDDTPVEVQPSKEKISEWANKAAIVRINHNIPCP